MNTNFVEPACGKGRHKCYYFAKVYVCACLHPSGFVRDITPTFFDGFQNYLTQALSLRRRNAI